MPERSVESLPVLLHRLWRHLQKRRRRQCALILVTMVVGVFADAFALGAVLPFLGVLVEPDKVFALPWVAAIAARFGIHSSAGLVVPMTIVFAVAAVIASSLRMLVLWASTRWGFATGVDLSTEVYQRTLYQPYSVHVTRNSSEVINVIVNKIGANIHALVQCLSLMSSLMLLLTVVATLMVMDSKTTLIAIAGFGVSYGVISGLARRRLRANSRRIANESTGSIKALQEGLGGIRDVLLDGTQPVYCDIYRRAEVSVRTAQAANIFLATGPRYALEGMGMVMIAALALSVSYQPDGIVGALPLLGALSLGLVRLLPTVQSMYSSWSTISGNQASIADVLQLLDQLVPAGASDPRPAPMGFRDAIEFRSVRFRYSPSGPLVLDGINLTIPKGSRVGIVGRTGSGKSTLMDVLMGLLEATEGQLVVDGRVIDGHNRRAWQQSLAHVPQAIYLADTSLAENIAFAVPAAEIDMTRVRLSAKRAQIDEFIEGQTGGYGALVGERGVRLSGGQRQRIGIARALYKQADVLVFDEATSALDSRTEHAVMEAIEQLDRDLTIILIAHRLTTVQRCDVLVELDQGRIAAQGTYEELLRTSPGFRGLAQVLS